MFGRRLRIAKHFILTLEPFPKVEWGQWNIRFALYFKNVLLGEVRKITVTKTQVIAELDAYTIAFNIGHDDDDRNISAPAV